MSHNYPIFYYLSRVISENAFDIFEYGCGDGRNYGYTKSMSGKSIQYTGYDINLTAISRAKELYPENKDNFIIQSIDEIKEINSKNRTSVALICYILCHLSFDEQKKLLDYCIRNHDYIVIYDSINIENIRNYAKGCDSLDYRIINWIKYIEGKTQSDCGIIFHPIILSPEKYSKDDFLADDKLENIVKQGNFGALIHMKICKSNHN